MTKIELLKMLENRAREFRKDRDHYKRNRHMHDITKAPPQNVVDAVLTGFINDIGIMQGVDYALYARDLAKPRVVKCMHCKQIKGDHQARTLACPMGKKHRTVGWTTYSHDTTYEAKHQNPQAR